MSSSTSTRGALGHRARLLLLGLALACVGMLGFAGSQAKAVEVPITIDNAQLNLGSFYEDTVIIPGPGISGGALPDMWTPVVVPPASDPAVVAWGACLNPALSQPCGPNPTTATIVADVDGGNVSIPATNFRFPIMAVPNPLNPSAAPVPFTLKADGALSGTVDGSGNMTVTGPWSIDILVGLGFSAEQGGPNPFYRCNFALPDLELTTGVSQPASVGFAGTPLDLGSPLTVALTGTWGIPNASSAVGPPGANEDLLAGVQATCASQVDLVAAGRGGIWVSSGIAEPAPYPECEAPQTGVWPDCVDPEPTPARISKVTVSGPSKAKRGKVASYRVTVTNSGETTATGVRLKASGKGVSFNTSLGSVAGNKSKSVTIKVKFRSKGKVKAKFAITSANGGGKSVTRTITVR